MSNTPRRPRTGPAARKPAQPPEPRPQSQPFDLDALERDGDPGPYWFTHAGTDYLLADPYGVDWQESEDLNKMLETGDTQGIMRRMLGEQYDEFKAHPMAAWKLDKLAEAWMVHYGLGEVSA